MSTKQHKLCRSIYALVAASSLLSLAACDQGTEPVDASSKSAETSQLWLSGGKPTPSLDSGLGLGLASSDSQLNLSASAEPNSDQSLPLMAFAPTDVCSGINYIDGMGAKQVGSKVCSFSECSTNNTSGCVANSAFKALDKNNLDPTKYEKDYVIAETPGKFSSALYPLCTSTGDTNCRSDSTYRAMSHSDISEGVIRAGVSLGPITGKYPSAQYKLELPGGITYNPLPVGNIASILSSTEEYHFWGPDGSFNKVKGDPDLVPSNIIQGQSIYGVAGIATPQVAADCTAENKSNCFIQPNSDWVAVDKEKLTADKIRNGVIIAGVTGTYPSVATPLATATSTPDLGADLNARLQSNVTFEFFDKNGARHQMTGDDELNPTNIRAGVEVFGVTGTFSSYDPATIKPHDVRLGVSLPGQSNFGKFDPRGGCSDKADCFNKHWTDVTDTYIDPQGPCTQGTHNTCTFRNLNQKLDWLFLFVIDVLDWREAANRCEGLSAKNHDDWRLPTQKELMVAANNGLALLGHHAYHNGRPSEDKQYWSSTYDPRTPSPLTRIVYQTTDDRFIGRTATQAAETVCVRSY